MATILEERSSYDLTADRKGIELGKMPNVFEKLLWGRSK
jgi:hypothetical protein